MKGEKKKSCVEKISKWQVWWYALPATGRQRQGDSWGWLASQSASQPSLISEFKASKRQGEPQLRSNTEDWPLASTCKYRYIDRAIPINWQTWGRGLGGVRGQRKETLKRKPQRLGSQNFDLGHTGMDQPPVSQSLLITGIQVKPWYSKTFYEARYLFIDLISGLCFLPSVNRN